MNIPSLTGAGEVALVGVLLLASTEAWGSSSALQLKHLRPQGNYSVADAMYRETYGQSLFVQFQDQAGGRPRPILSPGRIDHEAAFRRIVKKEPPQYACECPVRGMIKLGSQEFAFVLDSTVSAQRQEEDQGATAQAGSRQKAKPRRATEYDRLYFDFNHNGDLTDDKIVEGHRPLGEIRSPDVRWANCEFPPVAVSMEVEGTKVQYAFELRAHCSLLLEDSYNAYAAFQAAAYREGELTLEGRKRRIVLLDFNGDGRFDDVFKMRPAAGGVSQEIGDVLMLDPESNLPDSFKPFDFTQGANRYPLSRLINLEGHYYDLDVSPAGDRFSLTPSTCPLGCVTNGNNNFCAVLFGEQGFLRVQGRQSEPVVLPEGDWRLLAYTIDWSPPAGTGTRAADKVESRKPSSSQKPIPRTFVSAQGASDYPKVTVRREQTVCLPFGPPYKPVVTVLHRSRAGEAYLQMHLVGSANERCTELLINGNRPPEPEFTISTLGGEVVQRGKWKYG